MHMFYSEKLKVIKLRENIPVEYLLFYFYTILSHIPLPENSLRRIIPVTNFGEVTVNADKICTQQVLHVLQWTGEGTSKRKN
jgi:hypothetical protein